MSFLSVARAAKLSGISVRGIRLRIERNELATIYVGCKMFVVGSSFEQWLKRRSAKGH